MARSSTVFHPFFPLILDSILLGPGGGGTGGTGAVPVVGESIDLCQWFGVPQLDGILQPPDGVESPIFIASGDRSSYQVTMPGWHKFKTAENVIVRPANARRESDAREFAESDWTEHRPNTVVEWLNRSQTPTLEFGRVLGASDEKQVVEHEYDLAPVLAVLVLVCLLLEAIFLRLAWQTRVAEPVESPFTGKEEPQMHTDGRG